MKRKGIRMVLSVIIVMLMVVQMIPLGMFASALISNENTNVSLVDQDVLPDVVMEIKGQRDEFTKVYLLEDGSYYSVTACVPIHKFVDGEWIDIDDEVEIETNSVQSIENQLQQVVVNNIDDSSVDLMNENDSNIETSNMSMMINALNCEELPGGGLRLQKDKSVLAKPTSIYNYLSQNKVILEANLVVSCYSSNSNVTLVVDEIHEEWTEDTTQKQALVLDYTTADYITVNGDGTYQLEITDAYSRWDRGQSANNGIMISALHTCDINIYSLCISVRYELVNDNDLNYTYHTIDMNNAGKVYINDFTNTVKLEQDIIGADNNKYLPIEIKRFYSSVNPAYSNYAGIGSKWNYESNIIYADGFILWKMFDGTEKRFIQSDPLITSGEYQKWIDTSTQNNSDNAVLWMKTEELGKVNKNYSNFYIEFNSVDINLQRYNFNNNGFVSSILYGENNVATVNYNDANQIESIVDNLNHSFVFTYGQNETGYKHITNVALKNTATGEVVSILSNDDISMPVQVSFETSYDSVNKMTTCKTTYFGTDTVSYCYGFDGELREVLDSDGNKLVLNYVVGENNSFRLRSYIKYVGENVEIVAIDSKNTYQRRFRELNEGVLTDNIITDDEIDSEDMIKGEELLQYDRDMNVIAHKTIDGHYIFASYDDNGLISSYAVPEDKVELLVNSGFEESTRLGLEGWEATGTGSNYVDVYDDENDEIEDNEIVFKHDSNFSVQYFQSCDGLFEADQTYVFGANTFINNSSLPSGERNVKINIYPTYENETISTEPVVTLLFDTCAPNEWQYMLKAFKLEKKATSLRFAIEYDGGATEIHFDDVTLYRAKESRADVLGVTITTPDSVVKNADGSIDEILTDGTLSMIKSYGYDENGQLEYIVDHNGVTTYYDFDEDNTTEIVGTQKSDITDDNVDNPSIVNPTLYSYNAKQLIKSIQQTITSISTGNALSMITEYDYHTDNRIKSVKHNGLEYIFNYSSENGTNNLKSITGPDESCIIQYEYAPEDNNISKIEYCNGLIVSYEENENEIIVSYYLKKTEQSNSEETIELIKTIKYSYNEVGNLIVSDSKTGYTIEYTDAGYKLYRNSAETNNVLIYQIEKNVNGDVREIYYPTLYSVNGESKVVTSTFDNSVVHDSENDITTKSSTVSFNKIRDWTNAEQYDEVSYTYERQSITDYFGRVTQKSMELQTLNASGEKGKVTESYSYKELSPGVTSTLVSSYSTRLDMLNANDNTSRTVYSNEIFYEYDHNGNIIFEYVKQNESPVLKKYYEYDDVQQIVGEVNCEKGIAVTYVYDAGGNLIAKNYHNYAEAATNISAKFNLCYESVDKSFVLEKGLSKYGAVESTVTLGYDSVFKDRLVNYNGQSINYDSFGNPINYTGSTYKVSSIGTNPTQSNNTVTGTLEWIGNRLSAFETESERYEYEYDDNGYRTRKLVIDKDLIDSNVPDEYDYALRSETTYIWDNGVLKSVIFDASADEPLQSDIIYDQEGNIAGFVSYTGVAVYFVKDSNGSVKRLINSDGTTMASVTYDAWGVPTIKIHVNTSTTAGVISYLAYGIFTIINPSTYHGYLFDYETGLYFSKDRVYSPSWGRYLNMVEFSTLLEKTNTSLSANLYAFCNNNPVNVIEPYSVWANNNFEFDWQANGFEVDMREVFLSRPFCMIFANQILKANGTWSHDKGHNYCGMTVRDIAAALFAKCVGKNAMFAVNKVNACWGDGWILSNQKSDTIIVKADDPNSWKYEKIWYAASDIKMYAWSQGIYITL